MKPREIRIPVLRVQPSLIDVLKMEQGRLATYTFGRPTDPVFDVVTVRSAIDNRLPEARTP
jgi:hypothetical protein